MSITRAKKEILGFSADEIKQDLLEQRMERAAKAELERTAQLIKHTGFFDKVDNIYADPAALEKERKGELTAGGEEGEGEPGGGGGGGFGGGGMGGGEELGAEDLGGPAEEGTTGATAGAGGEAGAGGASEAGAEKEMPEMGGAPGGAEETAESIKKVEKLLMEKKERLQKTLDERRKKYETMYMDRLISSIEPTRTDEEKDDYSTKIYDKSLKINEDINQTNCHANQAISQKKR